MTRPKQLLGQLTFRKPGTVPNDRLREMMLYVSQQCEDDPTFGATKLNKILFYSDMLSFARDSECLTGVAYVRRAKGPVPKPLVPVRIRMEQAGEIAQQSQGYFGLEQKRTVALREPDLSAFTANQIDTVNYVVKSLWGKSAKDVSEWSHGIAWRIAGDGQEIPYEAIFLSNESLTDDDIEFAHDWAKRSGLYA